MDDDRAREITELLNGEGNCARCDDAPIDQFFTFEDGIVLGFCGEKCFEAFVRGIAASGTLRAS
jgi:hypothetical protein